jgi:hypothetical protein
MTLAQFPLTSMPELTIETFEILRNPPVQGFLTISNALQWRLQYSRMIERAGQVEGVVAVYRSSL